MGSYAYSGKYIYHVGPSKDGETRTHVADATSETHAHFLAAAANFFEAATNDRNLAAERVILEDNHTQRVGSLERTVTRRIYSGTNRDRAGIRIDHVGVEMIGFPASDIAAIRDLCEEGTQAHGDEFYGRILNLLDGKPDDWKPGPFGGFQTEAERDNFEADTGTGAHAEEVQVGTFHGQPVFKPRPLIVETAPVSGAAAVARAAESAARAFDNVSNVEAPPPEPPTSDLGGELAKGPAERLALLPQEGRAKGNAGEFDEKV